MQINITDQENYKKYLNQVTRIVTKHHGEYIIRGGKSEVVLGNWDYQRTVVVKFPSYDTAFQWYNSEEYAPIKKIREDNSIGNCIITCLNMNQAIKRKKKGKEASRAVISVLSQ